MHVYASLVLCLFLESTFVCLKKLVFILTRLGVAERVSERGGLWVGGWAEGWDHVSGLEFFDLRVFIAIHEFMNQLSDSEE